jgi:UDP-N-acetyl-D-mannosaminuronate dehydrogenase
MENNRYMDNYKIAVIGLGYVGLPLSHAFCENVCISIINPLVSNVNEKSDS